MTHNIRYDRIVTIVQIFQGLVAILRWVNEADTKPRLMYILRLTKSSAQVGHQLCRVSLTSIGNASEISSSRHSLTQH